MKYMPLMALSIEQAGFKVMPSRANFFIIKFADAEQAASAHAFLAERGIQLRGHDPLWFAGIFTDVFRDAEEMEITSAAFKDFAATLK